VLLIHNMDTSRAGRGSPGISGDPMRGERLALGGSRCPCRRGPRRCTFVHLAPVRLTAATGVWERRTTRVDPCRLHHLVVSSEAPVARLRSNPEGRRRQCHRSCW
jgi:hypothetical protein